MENWSQNLVPNQSPSQGDIKIMLIGEAPGVNEDRERKPFVGGSGRILDRLLRDSGISRGECYLGNVVRYKPKGNNFKYFHGTDLLHSEIDFLKKEVRRVKPNVIVPLGNEALSALTGKSGVTNWRGSILWSDELMCKVIPTVHPALVMRQWDYAPLALFDFKRIDPTPAP